MSKSYRGALGSLHLSSKWGPQMKTVFLLCFWGLSYYFQALHPVLSTSLLGVCNIAPHYSSVAWPSDRPLRVFLVLSATYVTRDRMPWWKEVLIWVLLFHNKPMKQFFFSVIYTPMDLDRIFSTDIFTISNFYCSFFFFLFTENDIFNTFATMFIY